MQDNGTADPTFSFPTEDPSVFITANSIVWSDAYNCVATFDVSNVNASLANVDVRVAGAKETDGTSQIASTLADVFSISTSITAILYVNSSGGEDHTTISAAIAAAANGNQIIVRAGTYNEDINFGNKELDIMGDVATPSNVIISGTGTGPVVTFSNSAKAQRLRGLIIENGAGLSSNFANVTKHGQVGYYGAGVLVVKAADVTLEDVIIRNNSAAYNSVDHNGGSGGGVYIADNSGVTMVDCTVTGNISEVYRGGGLCIDKSVLNATNVTFTSNAGGHYGGGLAAYNSILNFTGVTVSSNSLSSSDAQGADTYLHYTTINDAGGCNYGTKVEYKSSIL